MNELIQILKSLKNINLDEAIALLEKENVDENELNEEAAMEQPPEDLPPELMEEDEELYA